MKKTDADKTAALREALRAGDPGADPAIHDAQGAEPLRRRLRQALAENATRPARVPWLSIAAVAASLVAVWILVGPRLHDGPPVDVSTAPAPESSPASAVRQLQFETPGGTRIIWVMAADSTH